MNLSIIFTLLLFPLSLIPLSKIAQDIEVDYYEGSITIDGFANEEGWDNAQWHPINNRVYGDDLDSEDFSGQFKCLWDDNYLYVLAGIKDDSLADNHPDPLDHYWYDDCLEIFIDEDNTNNNHQYNHEAFAYHISTSGDVVDLSVTEEPFLLNEHVESKIERQGNTYFWECRIRLYNNSFDETSTNNPTAQLHNGKQLGIALAYCDSDGSGEREHFVVSNNNIGDTGWITTENFGTATLTGKQTTNLKLENHCLRNSCVTISPQAMIKVSTPSGVLVYTTEYQYLNFNILESGIYFISIKDCLNSYQSNIFIK